VSEKGDHDWAFSRTIVSGTTMLMNNKTY